MRILLLLFVVVLFSESQLGKRSRSMFDRKRKKLERKNRIRERFRDRLMKKYNLQTTKKPEQKSGVLEEIFEETEELDFFSDWNTLVNELNVTCEPDNTNICCEGFASVTVSSIVQKVDGMEISSDIVFCSGENANKLKVIEKLSKVGTFPIVGMILYLNVVKIDDIIVEMMPQFCVSEPFNKVERCWKFEKREVYVNVSPEIPESHTFEDIIEVVEEQDDTILHDQNEKDIDKNTREDVGFPGEL